MGSHRFAAAAILLTALCACGATDLFDPNAAQGIEGVALRGPMCPVQTLENPCPDEPYQAWVTVTLAADGAFVTRFQTDADGRFRVGLESGRYTLEPEGGNPFPVASEQDVDVAAGAYTDVVISFDTGIR